MQRTYAAKIENISYGARGLPPRFRCPFASPTGITSPPRKLLHPFAPSLRLRSSCHFFLAAAASPLSSYARTSFVRSCKSRDPEMYAVCDVFEALCSDTFGILAVCSRLSKLSSALVPLTQAAYNREIFLSVLEIEHDFFQRFF